MSLSIVVNGGGTFTASMEEGPVSFTASLGAVPGPKGDTGATGPTGVIAATAPILYDSGTQTVSLDPAYNPFDQSLNTTDSVQFGGLSLPDLVYSIGVINALEIYDGAGMTSYGSSFITFPDSTQQSTAGVPNPTAAPADGQILSYDEATTRPVWINNEARTLFVTARNNTGTTIAAGKVVYISGATGNRPTIALAIATSESTSARVIGITSEAIANNANGSVIVSGIVENIDTSAFSAGDVVYLSDSVAGGLRTTLPTQPLHGVVIGIVTRSNASVGSIEVTIQNYQELEELSDVLIASKANNDLLAWDSTGSVWKNKTFSTLGLLTASTAASTYAPLASPTFTGTVTIPAGASISGFAPLESPTFTGTPTLPTGTIAVTQAAGNSTTAVATTAFVQQEVPAASTTAAGKVELADADEARIGTASNRAVTPSSFPWLAVRPGFRSLSQINATAVSGSGAVTAGSGHFFAREMYLSSLGSGRAAFRMGSSSTVTGGPLLTRSAINRINFSNKIWMAGTSCMAVGTVGGNSYNGDADTVSRILLSGADNTSTADMTFRGIGIKKVGGVASFVNLTVHDGTNLTDVATTYANAEAENFEWVIYSDGTGNVTLWINGTQAATTTAGPTGLGNANRGGYFEQVYAASIPTVRQSMLNAGGWLYIES